MEKKRGSIQKLTMAGMLVALSTILSLLFKIEIPIGGVTGLKIGLTQLPLFLGSILLGPIYGCLMAVSSDIITTLLGGSGAYQPLFSLSAALFGVLPALFLHKRQKRPGFLRLLPVMLFTQLLTSTVMNTFFIHILFGVPVQLLLSTRIPGMLLDSVVLSTLSFFLLYALERVGILSFKLSTDETKA